MDHKDKLKDHEAKLKDHKAKLKDHKAKLKDHTDHMLILDHKDKLKDHKDKLKAHKDHKLHHVVDHELIQRMIQLSQMHNHMCKDLLDLEHGLSVPIDEAFMMFLFCHRFLLFFASSMTYMTYSCCLLLV